jgi:Na+/phosphate symporter
MIICLSFIIWPICFFITRTLYKRIINISPINGVSKQLMSIWIYILIFLIICFVISINAGNVNLRTDFFITELILFAFGLLCTHVFTKLKFLFVLSLTYSFVGLYIMISSNYNFYLSVLLIPFSFLLLGIYLTLMKRKVN